MRRNIEAVIEREARVAARSIDAVDALAVVNGDPWEVVFEDVPLSIAAREATERGL